MAKQLACNLNHIISLYSQAGFVVQTIIMDMKFNIVIPKMPQVNINITAASEHVAEIERMITSKGKIQGNFEYPTTQETPKYHDNQPCPLPSFLVKCNAC